MIFSLLLSHIGLASGLKESIAGFITGKNLSSIHLPLYSVIELALVKDFKHSEPTSTTQS